MKPIKIKIKNLLPLDTGLTSSIVQGGIIRGVKCGFKNIFNRKIASHTLLITEDHSRMFATQMTAFGLSCDSLRNYESNNPQLIEVWRWKKWTSNTRELAQQHLSRLRDIRLEYGFGDLILQTRYLKKIFFWIKDNPEKDICSENWFKVHKLFGLINYPKTWDSLDPSPPDLQKFFPNSNEFVKVNFK